MAIYPHDSATIRNFAHTLQKMHKIGEAVDMLDRAVQNDPTDNRLFCNMIEYRRRVPRQPAPAVSHCRSPHTPRPAWPPLASPFDMPLPRVHGPQSQRMQMGRLGPSIGV